MLLMETIFRVGIMEVFQGLYEEVVVGLLEYRGTEREEVI